MIGQVWGFAHYHSLHTLGKCWSKQKALHMQFLCNLDFEHL
jgi:hypothetical protein